MAVAFGFILPMLMFVSIFGVVYLFQKAREDEIKREVNKVVAAAGGRDVTFTRLRRFSAQETIDFRVTFTDANGLPQTREVTKHVPNWSVTSPKLMWDQPVSTAPHPQPNFSRLDSKEQIISDLSAEIVRLQLQLNEVNG